MTSLKDLLKLKPTAHYYGDIIRFLFIIAGALMLLTLPVLSKLIPVPLFVSIILIMLLAALAGLTNPKQKWIIFLDTVISIIAIASFEYYAVLSYSKIGISLFFIINQVLALIFLVAFYYSMKSSRGFLLKSPKAEE